MTLYFREWGGPRRPTVLLLHALGCHSGWWDWVGPELARHFRVIAPDFRGHGDSPWDSDYTFAAYAHDLRELVDQLRLGEYGLAGHSMGGYVALHAAASLTLTPSAIVVLDMKTEATDQELTDLAVASRRPGRTYATLDEAVARYRLSPPDHAVPADRLQAVARQCYRQQPDKTWTEKFDRRALAIEPLDPMRLAQQQPCPTLFVRGQHSVVMRSEPAAALAAVAGSQLVDIPGLHHHLPLEHPQAVAGHIVDFLGTQNGPFQR